MRNRIDRLIQRYNEDHGEESRVGILKEIKRASDSYTDQISSPSMDFKRSNKYERLLDLSQKAKDFLDSHPINDGTKNKILSAVIADEYGFWSVGEVHGDCQKRQQSFFHPKTKPVGSGEIHGFLTLQGKIVNVYDAVQIANRAGQYPEQGWAFGGDSMELYNSTEGVGFDIPLAQNMADVHNKELEDKYMDLPYEDLLYGKNRVTPRQSEGYIQREWYAKLSKQKEMNPNMTIAEWNDIRTKGWGG